MLLPRVVNVASTVSVISAAATAYSESSRPVSSLRNVLITGSSFDEKGGARSLGRFSARPVFAVYWYYLILTARLLMTVLTLPPRVVKTPTTASAIKAAATAYSESSRPVSSRRKFLIMFLLLSLG